MDSLSPMTITASRFAAYLHRCVFALACVAVLLCGLPWLLKALLGAAIIAVFFGWQRYSEDIVVSKIGCEKSQWWAVINGQRITVQLVDESLVLSWLVVLHLRERQTGLTHHIALWLDSAHREDLRRLRVFLRHA